MPNAIQAKCDRLRCKFRLEKARDTLAWLAEQMLGVGITHAAQRDDVLRLRPTHLM